MKQASINWLLVAAEELWLRLPLTPQTMRATYPCARPKRGTTTTREVAGIISSLGNPPMVPANHGGGAFRAGRNAAEEIEEQRRNNYRIRQNNLNTNRYSRQSLSDAIEWMETRKRKRSNNITDSANPQQNPDNSPLEEQVTDQTVIAIEATADTTYYNRWHVPRLGNLPEKRPDGVFRLMSAQLNGISSSDRRDKKVAEINRLIDSWEIQGGCFQEVGINWSAIDYNRNMTSWFRLEHRELQTHTAHNTHENIEPSQQGGVAQFMCKDLITFSKERDVDFRGLGRWASWQLYASPTHKTRVITAYNLGKRTSNYLGTVYQQHLRYIQRQGWGNITPHQLFMVDFLATVMHWLRAGERIIIFCDMNEHVLKGQLAKELISLGLVEATHTAWGEYEPNTHVSGSRPIDGVYHSSTLEVTSTMMLSFHEGVGDHRTILVDITARSLLGTDGYRIVRPAARRLTCSNTKSVKRFIKYVEKELDQHRLHQRLADASTLLQYDNNNADALESMEHIDIQMAEIFVAGEKQCRKLAKRPFPFSAPIAYWIHRKWAYQGLARIESGNCRNIGNARRRARKAGLDTFNLTYDQCMEGIKHCNNKLKQLKSQALGLRKVHLRNCLIAAEDANDQEKYKGILRVIEREEQRSMWRSIRRVTNDPQLGAITFVQRHTQDGIMNITDMDGMCAEIQEVTERRFALAESAPATNSSLRHSVGFLADTDFALDLIAERAPIPEEIDDTTRLVIEEMQRLWKSGGQERFAAFEVTSHDYRSFWKRIKESTSSSISTLHFGLYKAAMASDKITEFLADKITVIGSYGVPPSRWACGLQVMLEKIAGVALVNKLRAILLMEADYNFFNKWVFGYLAIDKLYNDGYIPEDQYSQRESTAEDARLDNRLTMDISRQQRIPVATISVDADKCYDRINHIIMSLTLLSIVGTASLISALLFPIQTMKFYQRTAWGDSKTFMGGRPNHNPLQGLCQGNGAAPACWLMISSLLMHCYTRQGFGSSILSPLSLALIRFLGEMYVDDTDLIIMKPTYLSAADVQLDAQNSVDAWAYLLNSTGGSLNPDKCYWYMVDYVCINGEWNYAPIVDWNITIPLPDGSRHPITQVDAHTSKKMLGVWSNPSGNDNKHLEENIVKKYKQWVDRSLNGHLPTRLNWKSYYFKLFPGIQYGLATLATPTVAVDNLLQKLDYAALPLLGINRSIKREWRNLPRAFGGVGLRNLAVEQMIGWANMLLQHYGSISTLGLKCKATLEALQLEIGCAGNPLLEDYKTKGILATPCWITAIWERCCQYKICFALRYDTIPPPRDRDVLIVDIFLAAGISGMDLRRLNRCRISLRAIYLSDITTASGRYLEQWVLGEKIGRQSKFRFPREEPCDKDWAFWEEFWLGWLLKDGKMPTTLGKWTNSSHQLWTWIHDNTSNTLWERTSEGWLEYNFIPSSRTTRGNRGYQPSRLWMDRDPQGQLASVKCSTVPGMILLSETNAQPVRSTPPKPSFWNFVMSQGGTWMWDHMVGNHDDMSWITTALHNKTAIMVTDGSYNRSLAPTVSGAGWTLVCTGCRRRIKGAFYEHSPSANSYRGELLGLTAIHHLVAFALEYYDGTIARGSIHCDNKGALKQASHRRKRVRTKTKHADLIRNLRYLKGKYKFEVEYHHVKAHRDDHLAWEELTLIEQLNVQCDELAKQAVQMSFASHIPRPALSQLLPLEQSALIVNGEKQTTDVSTAVRFSVGHLQAKRFFTRPIRLRGESNIGGLGWSSEQFETVDWESLNAVISKKPDMYGIWLSKQTTGFCASRRNMARIQGGDDDRCPNCLEGPERSTHLNRCLDQGRSLLFEKDVQDLQRWMAKNDNTDVELRYWITHFLLFRGERTMSSLGDMSPAMQEVANAFDRIGYTDVMHGRLPTALRRFQQSYCAMNGGRLSGKDWMKAFISKILDISHGQWLYRNFSLHNKTKGHLKLTQQAQVLTEIATLSNCQPEDIPQESRFLLEIDAFQLDTSSLTHQVYWVTAMKAALKAGRRRPSSSRPSANRQSTSCSTAHCTNWYRFQRRIRQLERKLREDLDLWNGSWRTKRRREASDTRTNGSNKRLRKPD